jgi:hypothetical protein
MLCFSRTARLSALRFRAHRKGFSFRFARSDTFQPLSQLRTPLTKCPWWLYSTLSLFLLLLIIFGTLVRIFWSIFRVFSRFYRRFLGSRTRYCLENLSQPIHIDFEQFGTRSPHIQPYNLDFRTFDRFWSRSHIRAPDIILKAFCYQSEPISIAFGPFDRISNFSISLFRIFPSLGHIHQSWTIHFVSAGVVVLENVS